MYSVIGADGQLYGPVPMDTLKQWCREGRILPTTNLLAAGSSQMLRASDINELHPFFVQSGPIPQSPNPAYPGQPNIPQNPNPTGQPNIQQNYNPGYQGQPQIQQSQDPSQQNLSGIRHDPYVPGGQQMPSQHNPAPGPYPQGPTPFNQSNYYRQAGAFGGPSQRSKTVAVVLALVFGPLGIHRFYLGYGKEGGLMLGATVFSLFLCCPGLIATTIWSLIDLVKIASGNMPDAEGNALV